MSGERFEEWLATFFRNRGHSVRLTPATGDYGMNLVLRRDSRCTVVQAKRWKGRVGPKAVQEVFAGKAHYKAEGATVVTNSGFTREAQELAKSTGVELWNREKLRTELMKNRKQPVQRPAASPTGGRHR